MERRTALALVCALALAGCGGGNSKPAPSGSNAGLQFAVSSATQGGGAGAYTPSGRIVVDSGFRAEANGFNFQNYGPGYQDLAPSDLEDLYGPRACASGTGPACQLTPPAEQWMAALNQAMAGGHCYGFSVTALLMYQHLLNPLDYGAPNPPALPLFGNVALQERIAKSFVLQTSQRVRDAKVTGTPNQVLDALVAALRNPKETYTVGIFNRDHSVGHAVTPYAVEDKGGGQFTVLIYDNNFPQITRGISFDRNQDSWSYEASRNPAEASQLLDGDATSKTISLDPTTPGVGVQPCPFCDSAQSQQISLNGDTVNHAHLTMSDGAGRKTGYVNGKLVNQIPGAQVLPLYLIQNWREHPEPIYRIPQGVPVTIAIDGSGLAAPDAESVTVIGPGYSAVAGNLTVRPGQRDELRVTGNGARVIYRTGAGHTQRPNLAIGVGRGGRNYSFTVSPPPIPAGSALTAVAQPARQRLAVATSGPQSGGSYSLAVTQIRRSGAKAARGRAVKVRSGGSAQLVLGRTR